MQTEDDRQVLLKEVSNCSDFRRVSWPLEHQYRGIALPRSSTEGEWGNQKLCKHWGLSSYHEMPDAWGSICFSRSFCLKAVLARKMKQWLQRRLIRSRAPLSLLLHLLHQKVASFPSACPGESELGCPSSYLLKCLLHPQCHVSQA